MTARNILLAIYAIGYWLYVGAAAVWYWPASRSLYDWLTYVLFQAIYAIFWPVLLAIQLVGGQ